MDLANPVHQPFLWRWGPALRACFPDPPSPNSHRLERPLPPPPPPALQWPAGPEDRKKKQLPAPLPPPPTRRPSAGPGSPAAGPPLPPPPPPPSSLPQDEARGGDDMMWVDVRPVFLSLRIQARVVGAEQYGHEALLQHLNGSWFPSLRLQQEAVEAPAPDLGALDAAAAAAGGRPVSSRGLAEQLLEAEADGDEQEHERARQRYDEVLASSASVSRKESARDMVPPVCVGRRARPPCHRVAREAGGRGGVVGG